MEETEGLNGVLVVKDTGKSKRKFKIVTQETTLYLKGETPEDRDTWIQFLVHETQGGNAAALQQYLGDEKTNIIVSGQLEEESKGQKKTSKEVTSPKNNRDEPLAFRMFAASQENQNEPTISQISDLLNKYEERLKSKRDESQLAYEKFSSELLVLESDLDKKQKEKFSKMKNFA